MHKVEENPGDPDARFALAQIYEWNDMVTEAIDQYTKLSELQPEEARWHKTIGDLYQKQPDGSEKTAKTAFAYRNAIEIEPNSYEFYNLLARALAKDNQLLEAAAVYRQALGAPLEKSEHDSALRGLWWVYTDKSKHAEGVTVLEELKSEMGASATLHELLGDGYKEPMIPQSRKPRTPNG